HRFASNDDGDFVFGGGHQAALCKNGGMLRTPAPSLVGRQSDEIASPVRGGRLRGGPSGCGVLLARLISAASLALTASIGIAIKAKLSARRLASSRSGHDRIGVVRGCVRRCRPALLSRRASSVPAASRSS